MSGQELQIQNVDVFFNPERLNMMFKMASQFVKSGAFGADVKSPEAALVKMQAGAEMGMAPMEAMNSLYIINGHVTIFGVAMSKRIRQAGWKIEYLDETDTAVTVKVSKGDEVYEYTATAAELNKLKSRAAGFALKDKLRWHAIGRLLRFNIPEVLGGAVTYMREELEDEIEVTEKVKAVKPKVVEKTFGTDFQQPVVDNTPPTKSIEEAIEEAIEEDTTPEIIDVDYNEVTPAQVEAKLAPQSEVPALEL